MGQEAQRQLSMYAPCALLRWRGASQETPVARENLAGTLAQGSGRSRPSHLQLASTGSWMRWLEGTHAVAVLTLGTRVAVSAGRSLRRHVDAVREKKCRSPTSFSASQFSRYLHVSRYLHFRTLCTVFVHCGWQSVGQRSRLTCAAGVSREQIQVCVDKSDGSGLCK
jgi:hypothetical protein